MKQQLEFGAVTKSLWLNAAIITRRLDNSLGEIHGIGLTEYMILFNLIESPNYTLRRIDLAKALARPASEITRLLQPMAKTGLVVKDMHETDVRMSQVRITAAGQELFNNASATFDAQSRTILENLDNPNAARLLSLLRMI